MKKGVIVLACLILVAPAYATSGYKHAGKTNYMLLTWCNILKRHMK